MSEPIKGFIKDRLEDKSDSFDCIICFNVARNPLECLGCGQIYCSNCQQDWKNQIGCYQCLKCDSQQMNTLNQHLMEVYQQLKYKCSCNQIFKLQDISKHEEYCMLPSCKFFEICNHKVSPQFSSKQVCSSKCLILELTQQNIKDKKKLYRLIMGVLNKNNMSPSNKKQHISLKQDVDESIPVIHFPYILNRINKQNNNQIQFKWDRLLKGINIQCDEQKVWLKENDYQFRSVVADTYFENGQHYFEVQIDRLTENELKIGVASNNTFNVNTAFCDTKIGFGYYTIGKLRNGSNMDGSNYGKIFKNSGTCGVFLDMSKGILAFSYNGKSLGIAFRNNVLTKSPIYASVSLMHCAGFSLKSGLNIPDWAKDLN